MADQIVIKFTRIAHRTPPYIQTLRENWWRHYLPFDTGGFHSHGQIDMGALLIVQLFAWTNCWTNIRVTGGLRRHRSHFHYWNFDRLSYLFRLERWLIYSLPRRSFTMAHTCTASVCRRTDRRTDKVQPIKNILLPPSQEENDIAISTNAFGVSFIENWITILGPFLPSIVFGNLR